MDFAADKAYKYDFTKDGSDFERSTGVYMEEVTEKDPKMIEIEKEFHKIFNILHMKL